MTAPSGGRPVAARLSDPRTRATVLGACSILLWAFWPTLATLGGATPPFQLLTIAFAAAFALFALLRLARGQPVTGLVRAPPSVLLAGLLGVLGANIFYILALRAVPPAEANIVAYTWPVMIVGLSILFGFARLSPARWLGLALGFTGAAVIIGPVGFGDPADGAAWGYALALASGLSWALYSVIRSRIAGGPADVIGGVCGLAAPVCLVLHLTFEPTIALTVGDWSAAIAIGLAPIGGANALWDYGISRGDATRLSIYAYATPALATLLLVAFGFAGLSFALVAGGALVTAGAVLGGRR